MAAAPIVPLPLELSSGSCSQDPVDREGNSAVVFFAADDVARHRADAGADQCAFCGVTALVTDDASCRRATERPHGCSCSGIGAAAA